MKNKSGHYLIEIDGRWSLEDLYIFPRTFEQVYFAYQSFAIYGSDSEEFPDGMSSAYEAFPWAGGYSAVNFYDRLKFGTPRQYRPRVVSMSYGSPGWFELELVVEIAKNVGYIVTAIAGGLVSANFAYNQIIKGMQSRELMRIKSEKEMLGLEGEKLKFIERSASSMARLINSPDVKRIHAQTGSPYKSLKILLSLYRRLRTLAELETRGKLNFEGSHEVEEDRLLLSKRRKPARKRKSSK